MQVQILLRGALDRRNLPNKTNKAAGAHPWALWRELPVIYLNGFG